MGPWPEEPGQAGRRGVRIKKREGGSQVCPQGTGSQDQRAVASSGGRVLCPRAGRRSWEVGMCWFPRLPQGRGPDSDQRCREMPPGDRQAGAGTGRAAEQAGGMPGRGEIGGRRDLSGLCP